MQNGEDRALVLNGERRKWGQVVLGRIRRFLKKISTSGDRKRLLEGLTEDEVSSSHTFDRADLDQGHVAMIKGLVQDTLVLEEQVAVAHIDVD